jgi:ribonucleoside-diphosphate reductase alpha chain
MYYYLHKASVQLAKEQGKCEWFDKTMYSHGMLPQDHDRIVDLIDMNNQEIKAEDWIELCNDIYKYGMRNSTLTACMPGESSSVLLGATNGVEPIRDILVYKKSPAGVTHTLAPGANDFDTLVSYQMAYDIDRSEYIKMMAVINAFMTQSISFNQYYNYQHFENEIIPLSELVKDFFLCNYYGLKTAYYHNSGGNNAQSAGEAAGCAGGGCSL